MEVVREQTIFIDSKQADGTSGSDRTVVIPPGLVECDTTQQLRISVTSFEVYCNLHNITADNNWVRLHDATDEITDIFFPPGCYRQSDIVDYWRSRTSSDKARLEFIAPINGWRFWFKDNTTVEFNNGSQQLFGMSEPNYDNVRQLVSDTESNITQPLDTVRLDLDNSVNTVGSYNLTNADAGLIKPWNALVSIPLRFQPFEWFKYEPVNQTHVYLADRRIETLHLLARIYDSNGQAMPRMPDYRLTVKVEVVNRRETSRRIEEVLTRILEFFQFDFLSRSIA